MSEEEKDQLSFDLEAKKSEEPAVEAVQDSGPVLDWVCHPAKRNLTVTAVVTVFLIALLVIVYYWTYSVWFVILGALILFGSLANFYFPTRYILSDEKIIIKTKAQTQEKKWEQYRSCYPDKNGILLSPFTRPTRMENFRGIYIRFWYNRDDVVRFVKERINSSNDSEGKS